MPNHKLKECPVCDGQEIQLFMRGIYDSETTDVMECAQCGLQFLDPLMTEHEESEYYAGYYRKQRSRHFREMGLAELQQRSYEQYAHYQGDYLKLIADCKSILEIGSGTGGFLRFVKEHNPQARLAAFERCEENVEFIRHGFGDGVEVLDSLDQIQGVKFDCIVAFGVFEHIRDSRGFLVDLRDRLARNGRLALNVPNKENALVYSYDLDEFRKFSYMKQHYFTFTEKAFSMLARQTGLLVERFNYLQVWGLDNHLSWLRYRKPRDSTDIRNLLSRRTLESYENDLIKNKKSDLMMVVLCKQDRLDGHAQD